MTSEDDPYVPPASNAKELAHSLNGWKLSHYAVTPFIDMSSFPEPPPSWRDAENPKDVPSSFFWMLVEELNGFPMYWELHAPPDFIKFAEGCWAQIEAFAIAPEPSEPVDKAAAKRL